MEKPGMQIMAFAVPPLTYCASARIEFDSGSGKTGEREQNKMKMFIPLSSLSKSLHGLAMSHGQ